MAVRLGPANSLKHMVEPTLYAVTLKLFQQFHSQLVDEISSGYFLNSIPSVDEVREIGKLMVLDQLLSMFEEKLTTHRALLSSEPKLREEAQKTLKLFQQTLEEIRLSDSEKVRSAEMMEKCHEVLFLSGMPRKLRKAQLDIVKDCFDTRKAILADEEQKQADLTTVLTALTMNLLSQHKQPAAVAEPSTRFSRQKRAQQMRTTNAAETEAPQPLFENETAVLSMGGKPVNISCASDEIIHLVCRAVVSLSERITNKPQSKQATRSGFSKYFIPKHKIAVIIVHDRTVPGIDEELQQLTLKKAIESVYAWFYFNGVHMEAQGKTVNDVCSNPKDPVCSFKDVTLDPHRIGISS